MTTIASLGVGRSVGLRSYLLVAVLSGGMVGCAAQQEQPVLASSAENPEYAISHGDRVERTAQAFQSQADSASVTTGMLKDFPQALKEPNWPRVGEVYQLAADDGRSEIYGEHFREEQTVRRFYEEEKKPWVGRAAGAAQHTADEKKCDVKLYGPVSYGFDKGLDKQVQERKERFSRAYAALEEHEAELGKGNRKVLEEQIDRLMAASYSIQFGYEESRRELLRVQEQIGSVRATLEAELEKEQQADKPDAKRKEALQSALAQLREEELKTEVALKDSETRHEALSAAFDKEFAALLEEVQRRAELAGTGAAAAE